MATTSPLLNKPKGLATYAKVPVPAVQPAVSTVVKPIAVPIPIKPTVNPTISGVPESPGRGINEKPSYTDTRPPSERTPAPVTPKTGPGISDVPETPGKVWRNGEFVDTRVPGEGTGTGAWKNGEFVDTRVPGENGGGGVGAWKNGEFVDTRVPGEGGGGGVKTPTPGGIEEQKLFNSLQPGYDPKTGLITPIKTGGGISDIPEVPGGGGISDIPERPGDKINPLPTGTLPDGRSNPTMTMRTNGPAPVQRALPTGSTAVLPSGQSAPTMTQRTNGAAPAQQAIPTGAALPSGQSRPTVQTRTNGAAPTQAAMPTAGNLPSGQSAPTMQARTNAPAPAMVAMPTGSNLPSGQSNPTMQTRTDGPAPVSTAKSYADWAGQAAPQVDDSVANRLNSYISQDSPLMQQARTDGLRIANSRGLLNSSLAAGASQDAMIRNAMPIAQQDASQAFQKNMQGKDFQYGLASQFAGQEFQGDQAAQDRALQVKMQNASLNAADTQQIRDILSKEGVAAADRALTQLTQDKDIAFQTNQAALNRDLEVRMQNSALNASDQQQIRSILSTEGVAAAERALQNLMQDKDITFQGNQASLNRDLETRMQNAALNAADIQQVRDIYSREGLAAAERALAQLTQDKDIAFQGNQAALNRDLELRMQNSALNAADQQQIRTIASTEGIEAANRALQSLMQERDITFQGNESALNRDLETRMQNASLNAADMQQIRDINSREGSQAADRALQNLMQQRDITFQGNENTLNRSLEERMQNTALSAADRQQIRDISSREGQAAADRALQEKLQGNEIGSQERQQQRDIEFQTGEAGKQRELQRWLAEANLDSSDRNAASQFITNMETMYQTSYQSIMANTALSAAQRTEQLTAAARMRDQQLDFVRQMYDIPLTWGMAPTA